MCVRVCMREIRSLLSLKGKFAVGKHHHNIQMTSNNNHSLQTKYSVCVCVHVCVRNSHTALHIPLLACHLLRNPTIGTLQSYFPISQECSKVQYIHCGEAACVAVSGAYKTCGVFHEKMNNVTKMAHRIQFSENEPDLVQQRNKTDKGKATGCYGINSGVMCVTYRAHFYEWIDWDTACDDNNNNNIILSLSECDFCYHVSYTP